MASFSFFSVTQHAQAPCAGASAVHVSGAFSLIFQQCKYLWTSLNQAVMVILFFPGVSREL